MNVIVLIFGKYFWYFINSNSLNSFMKLKIVINSWFESCERGEFIIYVINNLFNWLLFKFNWF